MNRLEQLEDGCVGDWRVRARALGFYLGTVCRSARSAGDKKPIITQVISVKKLSGSTVTMKKIQTRGDLVNASYAQPGMPVGESCAGTLDRQP